MKGNRSGVHGSTQLPAQKTAGQNPFNCLKFHTWVQRLALRSDLHLLNIRILCK